MGVIFSKRLKDERQHSGYTQREFAVLLGIPLGTYRTYESTSKGRREPDFDMLVKMATFLKTSTDYLLGKEEV